MMTQAQKDRVERVKRALELAAEDNSHGDIKFELTEFKATDGLYNSDGKLVADNGQTYILATVKCTSHPATVLAAITSNIIGVRIGPRGAIRTARVYGHQKRRQFKGTRSSMFWLRYLTV